MLGTGEASSTLTVEVVLFESHGAALTQPGAAASMAVTLRAATEAPAPTPTTNGVAAGWRAPVVRVSTRRDGSTDSTPVSANLPVTSAITLVAVGVNTQNDPVAAERHDGGVGDDLGAPVVVAADRAASACRTQRRSGTRRSSAPSW